MTEFFDVIRNRRSVKYFDSSVKIEREEILEMLDEANISPSSCNFQPWRYIVVDTPEGKEKLANANYNLTQNETSAAMIIVLGDLNYFDKFDTIYNEEVKQGHMTCGIWTMQFANIAHAKGYDTNIIGGFKRDKVSELFDLDKNLVPVMLIALGKKERDGRPSTRMSAKDLVRFE